MDPNERSLARKTKRKILPPKMLSGVPRTKKCLRAEK